MEIADMEAIDTQDLMKLRRQDKRLAIINVLSRDEFRRRHIPGSTNIPVTDADFVESVESTIGGRDVPVVVYCAGENCEASVKAAATLDREGFRRVYDYVGGMSAWQEAGRPVQAGMRLGGTR
jgi:rhodanese-related sulfurtransferase